MPDRVPNRLKVINGDKETRINRDEPAARELFRIPVAPSWFTLSQTNLWKQVCKELMAMRLLYLADLDALVQYVVVADLCNTLAAKINDLPSYTRVSDMGVIHPHPYFSMLDRAQTRLSMLGREFGLTPRARAALRMAAVVPNTEAGHETPASYFAGA